MIASGADLESANPLVTTHPLARQVQRHALFVTLLRQDSTLAPRPYYARAWHWSADRRTLTLSLVPDLRWHDGAPTTARDAAFTFLAARDRRTGFPRAGELATLDTVVATNDSTLEMRFSRAPAALPPLLAELPLLPAHLLDTVPRAAMRAAAFNGDPVGNGPFRFISRQRGARWSFSRNDAFPAEMGGPPRLRGFVIAVVDEATTKFAGLASGELDMAGISPAMATLARRDSTLRLVTYPVLFGAALFFNTTRPPFDDPRVRRAVARSIDRQRIVDVAMSGFGRSATSAVAPDSRLAWDGGVGRDTAAADALLDAAGWRRAADGIRARAGRRLEVQLVSVGGGDNVAEQLIQADLAARGIAVKLKLTELGSFLSTARAPTKTFDMLLAGVPGDVSLSYITAMFSSAQRGGTLDYTGFHTPALDALLAAAVDAPSEAAARRAWGAVQAALDTLAPATWIYHARGVQGMSRRVQHVHMDLRGELATIHDWSLTPRERSVP